MEQQQQEIQRRLQMQIGSLILELTVAQVAKEAALKELADLQAKAASE